MKNKIFVIVLLLCMVLIPVKSYAIEIERNWSSYTEILPSGVVGNAYNYQLTTTEKDLSEYHDSLSLENIGPEYKYYADSYSLPEGLSISESGVISGTPSKAGRYSFYVTGKRSITGDGEYYGRRYLTTKFTIYIYESDIDYSSKITVNYGEALGIFDKTFRNINNDGDLSIISGSSTYNGGEYTIVNNKYAYLYDVSFLNGKRVIDNQDTMVMDNVTFHYNESDDYIINNSKNLYLNNFTFSNNKASKYSIYNSGSIFLTGTLNTLVLNDSDYEKDSIYLTNNGEFYFDIRNGSATLSDFMKLQGDYDRDLYVILSEDMDNDKEYVLIENYELSYEIEDGFVSIIQIEKDEPEIQFVKSNGSSIFFDEISSIYPGESFTYNNHIYKLVEEKHKLVLKIYDENDSNNLSITGTSVTSKDRGESHGDIVTKKINVKNVIILSVCLLFIIAVIVFIIKRKKNN